MLYPTVSLSSRAMLILHYVEGLSLDEVAAILHVPPGTVSEIASCLRTRHTLASLRAFVWPDLPLEPAARCTAVGQFPLNLN